MRRRRVLAVEDNEDIAELVCSAGETLGMECAAAGDRGTILAGLARGPELILLDLTIPGISSEGLVELLAENGCRARIVLMSGVGRAAMEKVALRAGEVGLEVVGLLHKPFRVVELMEMLRR